MAIDIKAVKVLREATGASAMDCKKALEEAKGDNDKARALLNLRSKAIANKKQDRSLGAGIVSSYIHANGRVGVLIELLCETDFVARNDKFLNLAHDLALHVAAMKPEFVRPEDFPAEVVKQNRQLFEEEVTKEKKPDSVKAKIVEGKLQKFFAERSLLSQAFVKDQDHTVAEILATYTATLGERLAVGRFVRFEV